MAQLIRFELPNGASVLIEGEDDRPADGRRLVAGEGEASIARAEQSLEQAIDTARAAAELVVESFRKLNAPDEIQLEFGIKLAARAGVVIASADSEASFKLTLKWGREAGERQGDE